MHAFIIIILILPLLWEIPTWFHNDPWMHFRNDHSTPIPVRPRRVRLDDDDDEDWPVTIAVAAAAAAVVCAPTTIIKYRKPFKRDVILDSALRWMPAWRPSDDGSDPEIHTWQLPRQPHHPLVLVVLFDKAAAAATACSRGNHHVMTAAAAAMAMPRFFPPCRCIWEKWTFWP